MPKPYNSTTAFSGEGNRLQIDRRPTYINGPTAFSVKMPVNVGAICCSQWLERVLAFSGICPEVLDISRPAEINHNLSLEIDGAEIQFRKIFLRTSLQSWGLYRDHGDMEKPVLPPEIPAVLSKYLPSWGKRKFGSWYQGIQLTPCALLLCR